MLKDILRIRSINAWFRLQRQVSKNFLTNYTYVEKTSFTHKFDTFECMASKLKVGFSMSGFSKCRIFMRGLGCE